MAGPPPWPNVPPADACVKRVLDTLEELGGDTLLLVCSDHGMETTARTIQVDDLLVGAGLKAGPDSSDLVTAPNGTATLIYRSRDAKASVEELRRFLESQDWVDRIFTGPALAEVRIPTDGPVAAAVSLRTENRPNEFGIWGYGDIAADLHGRAFTGLGQPRRPRPHAHRPLPSPAGPGSGHRP